MRAASITDYIPIGKENAVTRAHLRAVTGLPDRKIREEIEQARRKGAIIINAQDGAGYYQSEDIRDIAKQYRQNERRALSILAQQKQQAIKDQFAEWIWKDAARRDLLTKLYNEEFNSMRPREYDGSHIRFVGMNPEIALRQHQTNAVARILYGGNTLLGHVVGAGKSATRS